MNNFTRDDYKKAIVAKYEIEKEGEYSNYFTPTSQANLRNLCWERFKSNENKDDLMTFNDFFGFQFDLSKKQHFSTNTTDKFRSIIGFFKRKKEPASFHSVELGAILVDFQPRPFKKFKEKGIIILENAKNNPNLPEFILVKPEEDVEKQTKTGLKNSFDNNKSMHIFNSLYGRFVERLLNRSKSTMIGIAIIFVLIAAVIYFAFFKKDCMQWSGDHFEVVDCKLKIEPGENKIEQLDKTLLDFKKVFVCDTTTYEKNGEPILWYSKNNNKVEFFNKDGRNPLNGKELSPVTPYMFNKYKEDCNIKKSGSAN